MVMMMAVTVVMIVVLMIVRMIVRMIVVFVLQQFLELGLFLGAAPTGITHDCLLCSWRVLSFTSFYYAHFSGLSTVHATKG